jgi:gliding motility-associated protein GldM
MINLMYLVLTALLALNISAEVMNAFFTINKGINNSNALVENTNTVMLQSIQTQADAYKGNEDYQTYLATAQEVKKVSDEFVAYVENLKAELFEKAGGPSEKDPSKPKREKDKDVTTRYLVGIDQAQGEGYNLMSKVADTRKKMLDAVNNDPAVVSQMSLDLDQDAVEKSGKKDWVLYNFQQMPVAAVFPILTKIQNDAKSSTSTVLNHLLTKMGAEDIKFDAFVPVVSASKGYVIRGEKYEADVFLSAFSTAAGDNTKVFVNGNSLKVEDGKARYETTASSLGTQKYKVKIEVTNPVTKDVTPYEAEFSYEVGERSVTVSADKMNVLYIGVDNPISVSAAGVSTNDLRVSASGGGATITQGANASKYIVKVTTPTDDCRVNVSGGGMNDSKLFRVKRIPDPVARLGNKQDGPMGNGEFKAQPGLIAWLDNFDFDAKCNIQGFKMVRVPKRQDPIEIVNQGGTFGADAKRLTGQAVPGDTYFFNEVKARCPGDNAGRPINSLVFNIR